MKKFLSIVLVMAVVLSLGATIPVAYADDVTVYANLTCTGNTFKQTNVGNTVDTNLYSHGWANGIAGKLSSDTVYHISAKSGGNSDTKSLLFPLRYNPASACSDDYVVAEVEVCVESKDVPLLVSAYPANANGNGVVLFSFDKNGKIKSGNASVNYETMKWYKLAAVFDKAEKTFSIYVDGYKLCERKDYHEEQYNELDVMMKEVRVYPLYTVSSEAPYTVTDSSEIGKKIYLDNFKISGSASDTYAQTIKTTQYSKFTCDGNTFRDTNLSNTVDTNLYTHGWTKGIAGKDLTDTVYMLYAHDGGSANTKSNLFPIRYTAATCNNPYVTMEVDVCLESTNIPLNIVHYPANADGAGAVLMQFNASGKIVSGQTELMSYEPMTWYHVEMTFNKATKTFDIYINGTKMISRSDFASKAGEVMVKEIRIYPTFTLTGSAPYTVTDINQINKKIYIDNFSLYGYSFNSKEITFENDGTNLTAYVKGYSENADVYFAGYDASNELKSIALADISEYNKVVSYTIAYDETLKYKVFVWDGDLNPFGKAEYIK